MSLRLPFPSAPAVAALLAAAAAASASAQPAEPAARLPGAIEACAPLRVDAERLACFDRAVAAQVKGAPAGAPTAPEAQAAAAAPAAAPQAAVTGSVDDSGSYLDALWELTPERKRGTFNFSGYRPNYFFPLHATTRVNRHPRSPAPDHSGTLPHYRSVEAKLQISLRTKLAEGLLLPDADLWFAYTQQSLWQIYSGGISRPFRVTEHEPELVYVVPFSQSLPFGWRTRLVGLGLAHHSNGQALPFSRSWNRWYAMAAVENGPFAITARHHVRIHESDDQDDNPDLTHFRGRTELLGVWTPGAYTLSALWRTNFDTRHGSLQLDATMPVNRKDPKGLRWYLQAFSGYGETLIDYNFRQSSIGFGVTLFGW
ncbi:phospholipase A [Piscinibacter koreensis]|uniref:Phospholipase A1 n=1 Tax=Piscinibacter koreensis TaxID=2742824 RepID=A0A7Y6TUX5_9BURK|nr:phospholipase A [Schlegelella koreensis]NUZ04322.1 phospholipase A [Schlegelella koreensis]